MAKTYTIELDGKKFDIQGERAPTEAEARQAVQEYFGSNVLTGFNLNNQAQKADQVENQITNRRSMIQDLTMNPPRWNTPSAALGSGLRTLGGASELLEGIPASIGMNLLSQEKGPLAGPIGGNIGRIIPDLSKVVTGNRPIQYGDIAKASNVPIASQGPIPAVLGMLLAGSQETPSGSLGTVVNNTVMKPVLKGLGTAVQGARSLGVPIPKLSEAISFMTGGKITSEQVEQAINNPNILDKKTVNSRLEDAKDTLGGVRDSLVNDTDAKVPIQQADTFSESLGLRVKGQPTRELTQLTDSQSAKVQKWVRAVQLFGKQKGGATVNDVDGTIAEIDKSLEHYYKAVSKDGGEARTPFEAIAGKIRTFLSENLKTAHPDLGAALDEFSQASKEKTIHDAFFNLQNQRPSFFRALPISLFLKAGGAPYLVAGPAAYASTFSSVYGKGIQGISQLGGLANRLPGLVPNALRNAQQS